MFVKWDPAGDPAELDELVDMALETYRAEYAQYYKAHALPDSPAIRDASPTVVLIPGVGMFSFGKNKTESRITGEFYTNAIGVMQGAGALGAGVDCKDIPQAGPAAAARPVQHPRKLRRLAAPARPSASSIGSSKKPRSAASRPRRTSAVAS